MTSANLAASVTRIKHLTFKLSDEVYGVDIRHVREIVAMLPATYVPNAPKFIRGVINLRGKIIPLMDLRLKFSLPINQQTHEQCIVIMDLNVNGVNILAGIIVDSVCDVTNVEQSKIEPLPEFGTRLDTSFLLGMIATRAQTYMLLDIEKALSTEEKTNIQTVAESETSSQMAGTNS